MDGPRRPWWWGGSPRKALLPPEPTSGGSWGPEGPGCWPSGKADACFLFSREEEEEEEEEAPPLGDETHCRTDEPLTGSGRGGGSTG